MVYGWEWSFNKMRKENITTQTLASLQNGENGLIIRVSGEGAFRKRLTEMGFIRGKVVKVIKNAPLLDPIEYSIMGYEISLRRSEAEMIELLRVDDDFIAPETAFEGTYLDELATRIIKETGLKINVALVGNPNSGKTTLFNQASGRHERVGNYSGVTVDAKEARITKNSFKLKMVDLPGTYSLSEYTPEELYVRDHLIRKKPDVVINVIDASNLERNMFLTTQLIDMGLKVIIALNMYDELEHKGVKLDRDSLSKMLGIPIIPTIAIKGKGIQELIDKVIEVYKDEDPVVRTVNINFGQTIEKSIRKVKQVVEQDQLLASTYPPRYLAIKLLEEDHAIKELAEKSAKNKTEIAEVVKKEVEILEDEFSEISETILTDARYGFIAGALRETCSGYQEKALASNRNIDDLLTHKIWGFPVFIFFMWLMFQATFTLGSYPMEWIDMGVGSLSSFVSSILPDGPLHDLIVDGIIGGVGGVIIFLPNILILFFFISLMEDTGYMARVSFIMDRLMHKIGLHGKSFIPLLMGFGCNVPAVMATRTLENRKDRIMTMLIAPFMSCSARLPVYVLIISAFFPKNQGLVLFSIYLIGIALAVVVALIMKKTVFAGQDVPFVMELPPYRFPTLKNTTQHMWYKGSQYLRKMGTFILLASILIWGLSYYPRNVEFSQDYDGLINEVQTAGFVPQAEKQNLMSELELAKASEHQEQSYIGRLGKFIEPAIQPLGFDWKIGISIITGLAAKEIVVSSMGILYQADADADEASGTLIDKLQQQVHTKGKLEGQKVFTPLVAFGFMLFILIYFPCVAVIAAIRKESNWRWAVFTMFYTTAIAWLAAFATFQIGSLFV